MNKLFQTALMAALLVTSGSASESPTTIVGKATFEEGMSVDSGTTLTLADGAEATLTNGATIEVMGTLEGPATGNATIKCEDGKATIDINTSQLETMESSDVTTLMSKNLGYSSEGMTYYHMEPLSEAGKIENRANIIFTNVDVTENSLLGEVQGINDSDKTLVLADNSGSEPAQMTLKNPNNDAVEVKVNLANEGYSTPYPLTITGSFDFNGDNRHYTQGTATFDNSKTAFSEDNSAFQSEMNITNQSVVTFDKAVTLSKDVVVSNSEIVFKELVKLTNGAKLVIGGALTPALTYVINFPKEEGWNHDYLYKFGTNNSRDNYYLCTMLRGSSDQIIIAKVASETELVVNSFNQQEYKNDFFALYNDASAYSLSSAGIIADFENLTINYSGLSEKQSDTVVQGYRGDTVAYASPITYGELLDLFTAIETGEAELKDLKHTKS